MKKMLFIFVLLIFMLLLVTGCGPNSLIQINTPVANKWANTPIPKWVNTPAPNVQINVSDLSTQFYAPGTNPQLNTTDANGRIAGVWQGVWHGVISPVTLVLSFFNEGVQIYEVHNDGNQYNLGYLIGVALVFLLLGALLGSRHH
jgi:hypothetical protein